jgi:hypothetical protein
MARDKNGNGITGIGTGYSTDGFWITEHFGFGLVLLSNEAAVDYRNFFGRVTHR